MSTEHVAETDKRNPMRRVILAAFAGLLIAAGFSLVDKDEAINEAALVMNYFLTLFVPEGTATTETNPND